MARTLPLLFCALCLGLGVQSAPVLAEAVTTLIAEKATATLGAEMPPSASFDVTVQTQDTTEAQLVSDFWMDRDTGQFVANVVTEGGETRRIYGMAVLELPVPVPTHRIMPDAILAAQDFRLVTLPYARIGAYAVTDLKKLVGMQVSRMLSPDRPVMTQSVMLPLVIDRGARVLIHYTKGRMTLSAPGKAIDEGHADQQVRVINLASNKTVVGIAQSNGTVEVGQ